MLWVEGRGGGLPSVPSTIPTPNTPPVQVLEVLTAAVEYGLEELREVGVSGKPSCLP